MNGDLISREALLDTLEDCGFNQETMIPTISLMNVLEFINNQPTAYDVDKVVEQINTYKAIMQNNMDNSGHDGMAREYYRGRKSAAVDFLEIIGRSCQG